MFSIKLTDGEGNELDPEKFAEHLTRQALEVGQKGLREKIESFVCAEHGQSPKLVEGTLVDGQEMKYSFCCEDLKARVVEVLQ